MTTRKYGWLALAFAASLVLAACSDKEGLRPTGGTGGTGGGGGTGGEEPPPGPSWENVSPVVRTAWHTPGDITIWKKGRFGPDGQEGYVFGGGDIGAVAEDGTLIWRLGAEGGAPLGDLVLDLHVVPLGGKADHVLATTVGGRALLVDGEDGSVVWFRELSYHDERRAEMVLLGDEDEPLFYSVFGKSIHSVKTGEVAWNHGLRNVPIFAQSLPRGEGQSPLVVLAVDPGPERVEEEPDLFAFTTDGEPVFSVSSGRYVTQLGWAPLGEDGAPLLLVGTNDARLVAFSAEGVHQWTRNLVDSGNTWLTYVDQLLVADIDADGGHEIFVELESSQEGSSLLSLAADGTVNFRRSLDRQILRMEWLEASGGPRLILSFEGFPQVSDVATVDARTGDDLQSVRGLRAVRGFERAHDPSKIFVGMEDGRAEFLDENGATEGAIFVGNAVLGAVPASAEGALVTTRWGIVGSVTGVGTEWRLHFDPNERSFVGESHFFEEEGRGIVVVSGVISEFQEDTGTPGFHFITDDGERLPSISLYRQPTAFTLANLDGEGPQEIVTVHYPATGSNRCTLAAYERKKGDLLWETEVGVCNYVWVHAGDVEGDGRSEVAVTGFRVGHPAFAGLVDSEGSLKWLHEFHFLPFWTLVLPGGVAFGGSGDDGNGFAVLYDPESGEKLWETRIPSWRNPDDPLETRQGFAYFATAVGDRNEDGFDEIALTTVAGEVFLLDGKTGSILWRRSIRGDGSTSDAGGGPIAWVPATEDTPEYLVVTEQESRAVATTTAIFDLEGNRRGEVTSRGGVASVTRRKMESGEWRVALAESFGARVIAVAPTTEDEDPGEPAEE